MKKFFARESGIRLTGINRRDIMWRQFSNIQYSTSRGLYVIVCVLYILVLSLPITIVNAEETPSVPETAASATQPEAPVPETVTPSPTTSSPTAEQTTQTTPTTEEKDNKYTYNPTTGKWENGTYAWDPNTQQTAPLSQPNYSYNPETNRWDTTDWVYSPEESKYIPPTQAKPSVVVPSANVNIIQPVSESLPTNQAISISQPESRDELKINQPSNNDYYNLFFNANISTTHSSHAISGNASILQNTLAGNAISGDASAMVNIINMIQSVWGWQGLLPEFYTANIQGDYYGDILINPTNLASNSGCNCQDTLVNSTINASIENNVDLIAKSGDVVVANNTQAGDARSGDATAIANIINLINTSMVAGKSFIGNININGNLEGDILMPENFLDSLVASNIPSMDVSLKNTGINLNDSTQITNNINTIATSGEANVNNNTQAGSATSGDAQTNVRIFNLTNRSVVGQNALLVFVNVAGEWAGFITDAPSGATVAMLGSGITKNTCMICSASGTTADLESKTSITNNIDINATTGSADVSHNTIAGSATSGDATAMANTANFSTSNVSFSGWFGILFINVLNNWLGSFGTNTAYGNSPKQSTPQSTYYSTNKSVPNTGMVYGASVGASSNQQKPKIRAYSVSFAKDKSGNIVLASAEKVPTQSHQSNALGLTKDSLSKKNNTLLIALASLLASAGLAGIAYKMKL
jgi:hypothetical protein